MAPRSLIDQKRRQFHKDLLEILTVKSGVASNADRKNAGSKRVALRLAELLAAKEGERKKPQTLGTHFELAVSNFIRTSLKSLKHVRAGRWEVVHVKSRGKEEISQYSQYSHLSKLAGILKNDPSLEAYLGNDYSISPDVVVIRHPVKDAEINKTSNVVDQEIARNTELRHKNSKLPILHASISTKWTMRSDRAQNTRTEALNLIRNRKGRLPHVMAVTAEPLPSRLASIAVGTGDVDCVYHIALYELEKAVEAETGKNGDKMKQKLSIMIEGKRLKDISDLPLDLMM